MRASYTWLGLCALWVPVFIACGSKKPDLTGDDGTNPMSDDASGSGSSGGGSSSGGGGSSGVFASQDAGVMITASDCKAGHYQGSFDGSYSSGLIAGIPLTVTGDVNLTLNQAGGSGMMCMVAGEGFVMCSDVFTLSGGTITGTADQNMLGDAIAFGGYPYFCSMTGTIDCAKKKLVNGWIQCTYCVGSLADGGMGCNFGILGGDAGIGGHFAGPLTADYNTTTHTLTNGTWNGAESLAGNDGTMPGPDGGPITDYLALDGGYGFLGKYGGAGDWSATLK
jgi:hypothetical protein